MIPTAQQFKRKSAEALANDPIQANLRGLYTGFHQARQAAGAATPGWEEMRDRGRDIKTHTIRHLDHYLGQMADNVTAAGGKVFFARDAEAANRYVVDLARSIQARTVIKSKSMVSEETGLGARLDEAGIEAVETDLGEYIIQLADESPFHIIAPGHPQVQAGGRRPVSRQVRHTQGPRSGRAHGRGAGAAAGRVRPG